MCIAGWSAYSDEERSYSNCIRKLKLETCLKDAVKFLVQNFINSTEKAYNFCLVHRKDLMAVLVFSVISLNTLSWFKGYQYILQVDNILSIINPKLHFVVHFYAWDDVNGIGKPNEGIQGIPFLALYSLLNVILGNSSYAQKALYFILFYATLLSMYFVLRRLIFTKGSTNDVVFSWLLSLIYATMPVTYISFIWERIEGYTIYYILQPLIILFMVNILKEKKVERFLLKTLTFSIIINIFSVGITIVTIHLMTLYLLPFVFLFPFFYRRGIKGFFKNITITFSLLFTLSSWFVIPYFATFLYIMPIESGNIKYVLGSATPLTVANTFKPFTTIFDSFIMYSLKGLPHMTFWYISYKYRVPITIMTLSFVLTSFVSLLFIRRMDKELRYITLSSAIGTIITVFIAKGLNEPLPQVNNILLSITILAPLLRHYAYKVILLLPLFYVFMLATLIKTVTYCIREKNGRNEKYKIVFVACCLIVTLTMSVFVMPFITGKIVATPGYIYGGPTNIPSQYPGLSDYISENSKILVLPLIWKPSAGSSYSWTPCGTKIGRQILNDFVSASTVQYVYLRNIYSDRLTMGLSDILIKVIENDIENDGDPNSISNTLKLLKLLDIDYVFLHKDLDSRGFLFEKEYFVEISDWHLYDTIFNVYMEKNKTALKLILNNTFFEVYQLNCLDSNQVIIPKHILLINDLHYAQKIWWDYNKLNKKLFEAVGAYKIGILYDAVSHLDWHVVEKSAIILSTDNKNKERILEMLSLLRNVNATIIKYDKVAPTEYIIHVRSQTPFLLVHTQAFSPLWKCYVNNELIPEDNHLVVNAVYNGWVINKAGELYILLKYQGQYIYELSFYTFITTLIFVLSFMVILPRIKKR